MRAWLMLGAVAGTASWAVSRYLSSAATSTAAVGSAKMGLAPVIAISHGGGPLPLLGDPNHSFITESLKTRARRALRLDDPSSKPRAIVLVTAHWATRSPTITNAAKPALMYDYYGFPPESYNLSYPAAGSPEVADEVARALSAEGLAGVGVDGERGWDHGVFVPMMLINPSGDVPIVQVSTLASQDPESHLRMGRALGGLRSRGVAVVGSGFASFHNLRRMMPLMSGREDGAVAAASAAFNAALTGALAGPDRWGGLRAWRGFPGADVMHPPAAGEHFMPLVVCAGAAGAEEETRWYKDRFLGVDIYTYYWGAGEV